MNVDKRAEGKARGSDGTRSKRAVILDGPSLVGAPGIRGARPIGAIGIRFGIGAFGQGVIGGTARPSGITGKPIGGVLAVLIAKKGHFILEVLADVFVVHPPEELLRLLEGLSRLGKGVVHGDVGVRGDDVAQLIMRLLRVGPAVMMR